MLRGRGVGEGGLSLRDWICRLLSLDVGEEDDEGHTENNTAVP